MEVCLYDFSKSFEKNSLIDKPLVLSQGRYMELSEKMVVERPFFLSVFVG